MMPSIISNSFKTKTYLQIKTQLNLIIILG